MNPRPRAKDRLGELVAAALEVFTRNGYRATQMADIARQMGVTEAALYRYVESKEGLFRLVIRQALLQEPLPDEDLPLRSAPLEVTRREIRERLAALAGFGLLAQAQRRRRVDDPAGELEGIVRELYALTAISRSAMDMIERSAREVPELAELVLVELRRPMVDALTSYLRRRAAAGYLRATPDPAVTARMILESVTWFARHRFRDPDGATLPAQLAEDTVVDLVVHALTPAGVEA